MDKKIDQDKSSEAWKEEGNEAFKLKNYEEAIVFYSRAIDKNGSVSVYFSNRARCYSLLEQWEKAVADCRKAVELDSKNIKGYYLLGQAIVEEARMKEGNLSVLEEGLDYLRKAHQLCIGQKKRQFEEPIQTLILRTKKIRWYMQKEQRAKENALLRGYLEEVIERADVEHKQRLKDRVGCSNCKVERELLQEEEKVRRVPDYFECKITMGLLRDPVILSSGFTYEREAIEQHFKKYGYKDPVTRESVVSGVVANVNLRQAIEQFLEENPWAFEQREQDRDYRKIVLKSS